MPCSALSAGGGSEWRLWHANKSGERNLFGYPEDSKLVGGGIGGIWVLAVRLEALVAVLNGACGMLIEVASAICLSTQKTRSWLATVLEAFRYPVWR